jgi:hypothetical protein
MNLEPDDFQAEARAGEDEAERLILLALEAGRATKAQLQKATGAPAPTLDAVLARLLAEARVFSHYKPLKSGLPSKTLVGYALEPPVPPSPSAWVFNIVDAFEDTAARAAASGLTREALLAETIHAANLDPEAALLAVLRQDDLDVRALLLSVARQLNVSLSRASHRPAARHSLPPASRKTDTEIVLQVLAELCRLAPAEPRLPILRLRTATKLDKSRFDRAVLVLAKFGNIELVPHAGDSLTEQQAELLIDPRGSRFSHVVARRNP